MLQATSGGAELVVGQTGPLPGNPAANIEARVTVTGAPVSLAVDRANARLYVATRSGVAVISPTWPSP